MSLKFTDQSRLQIFLLPALQDNYIAVLHDTQASATAVVDPSAAEPVRRFLKSRGWGLDLILNTHHHHDHVGGNVELKELYGAPVFCSAYDKKRIAGADRGLTEQDEVLLGGVRLEVLDIPGHTLGHIAYHSREEKALFAGDTLFSMGCGRLFEGTAAQMHRSLEKLAGLPSDTRLYCGHEYTEANGRFAIEMEPDNAEIAARLEHVRELRAASLPTLPSTLGLERKTNPFLRAHEPSLKRRLGLPGASDLESFTRLRQLKDGF